MSISRNLARRSSKKSDLLHNALKSFLRFFSLRPYFFPFLKRGQKRDTTFILQKSRRKSQVFSMQFIDILYGHMFNHLSKIRESITKKYYIILQKSRKSRRKLAALAKAALAKMRVLPNPLDNALTKF